MNKETVTWEEFEELNRLLDEKEASKKLRHDRPWTRDIIRVLWGTQSWISMDQLTRELWAIRNPSGLPMPKNFGSVIRATLNLHTAQSKVYARIGKKPDDDLFYSPKGKHSGTWAVHRERALAWLRARNLPDT